MGFFKKKIIKAIYGGAWGHLVSVHKMDVDTLSNEMRCVDREGTLDNGSPVTFLRVFKPKEVVERQVEITGWETFDHYPELVIFEGYLTKSNEAHLERRKE